MTRRTSRTPTTAAALIALGLAALSAHRPVQGLASERSRWLPPENLGANVNSAFEDASPHLSSDGLALYFSSTRPESLGGEDLFVSRRATHADPWGPATNLGPVINTPGNERSPALSLNRRLLFFATDRPGGLGGFDVWQSWRPDPDDDAGWQPPVNLGTAINTVSTDAGPSFFEDGRPEHRHGRRGTTIPRLFMASNRAGGVGGLDLYVGSVPGGWAGPATLISELNSPQADLTPTVGRGGLEIIFASARPGVLGAFDLWQSVRQAVHQPWSAPINLGEPLNTTALEVFPSLSVDGHTLLFQSTRPGGFGGSDLYLASR